jgi:hypothetical protein
MDGPGECAKRGERSGGCGGFASFSGVESSKFDDEPTALVQTERLGYGNRLSNFVHRHARSIAHSRLTDHSRDELLRH